MSVEIEVGLENAAKVQPTEPDLVLEKSPIFKFLGIVFLLVVPAVVLLKPPKGASHAPVH